MKTVMIHDEFHCHIKRADSNHSKLITGTRLKRSEASSQLLHHLPRRFPANSIPNSISHLSLTGIESIESNIQLVSNVVVRSDSNTSNGRWFPVVNVPQVNIRVDHHRNHLQNGHLHILHRS